MLAEILALAFIAALYIAAFGVLALPKHWYRTAQVFFIAATVLSDVRIIQWVTTSTHTLGARAFWCYLGLLACNGAAVWFVRKVQRDIREAESTSREGARTDYQRALIESWRRMVVGAERKYKSGKEPGVSFAEIFQRQPDYLSLSPLLSSEAVAALEADEPTAGGPPDALRSILAKEITRIETRLKLFPNLLPDSIDAPSTPQLTFEIGQQTIVKLGGGKIVHRIDISVRVKCFKVGDRPIGVKTIHASLHKESQGRLETLFPKEHAFVPFNPYLLNMDNWVITDPITNYWFGFWFELPVEEAKRLSREHVLSVTLTAVGQDPQSVEFYTDDWEKARREGSKITIRVKGQSGSGHETQTALQVVDRLIAFRDEGKELQRKLAIERVLVPYADNFEEWKARAQAYLDKTSNGFARRFKSETPEYPYPGKSSANTKELANKLYARILRLDEFIRERGGGT